MPHLLLYSPGLIHPSLRAGLHLRTALENWSAKKKQTWVTSVDIATLKSIPSMDPSSTEALIVVLYFHGTRLDPALLPALRSTMENGAGLLALHSATASFKKDPAWADFLGARFTGHGPVENFQLEPVGEGILKGLSPFSLRDEVYRHSLAEDCQVEAMAKTTEGTFPYAYSRKVGQGRLFYFGAGHRAASWDAPGSQSLLGFALDWLWPKRGSKTPEAIK
jgi:type 1 glutamine amidotransferase